MDADASHDPDGGISGDAAPDGDAAPPPDPGLPLPPYAGRIVISPSALLLTAAGQQATLRAQVFDAAGQMTTAAVTWESSRTTDVAIDGAGQVTAGVAVGYSQIRARAGGLVSPPVQVLVAVPAAGAVLVSDAQVVAGPSLVDPATADEVGTHVRLTLDGVGGIDALPVGTVLLAKEGKPVAGRVFSVAAGGTAGQLEVELQTIPLLDAFARLESGGTFDVDGAALADFLAQQPPPVQPALDLESPVARRALSELAPDEFRLGPFTCKKFQVSGGALTGTASLTLLPSMKLDHHFQRGEDGDWSDAMVKLEGKLEVKGTATLNFAPMLAGKFSCEVVLYRLPVPLGGPLAALVGFKVPLGFQLEISGAIQSIPLKAGFELKGESNVRLGFQYTPAAGTQDLSDFSNKYEVVPKFELPQGDLPFSVGASAALGGLAGLDMGMVLPFGLGGTLNLIKAGLTVNAQAMLTTGRTQIDNGTFVSNYDIKPVIDVGPGKDAAKALKWLGGAVVLKPAYKIELPAIAESPRGGSFTAMQAHVLPGMPVTMTAVVKPESLKFLGIDNVVDLSFWQVPPGMEPKLVKTLTATPGQSTFGWSWPTTVVDVGTHVFFAQATSKLAPGVPIAIGKPLEVRVGRRVRWRGTLTCTKMGTEVTPSGTGTRSSSFSITAEHATDMDAQLGTLTVQSLQASDTYTFMGSSTSGTATCPVTTQVDIGHSAMTSDPNHPMRVALLLVNEDSGYAAIQGGVQGITGEAHHIVTTTRSGDPANCNPTGTTVDMIPAEFTGSWNCFVPGAMFQLNSDTISGTATTTESSYLTVVTTWSFQRI